MCQPNTVQHDRVDATAVVIVSQWIAVKDEQVRSLVAPYVSTLRRLTLGSFDDGACARITSRVIIQLEAITSEIVYSNAGPYCVTRSELLPGQLRLNRLA